MLQIYSTICGELQQNREREEGRKITGTAFVRNKDIVIKRLQIHLLSKLLVGGHVKWDKPEIDATIIRNCTVGADQ